MIDQIIGLFLFGLGISTSGSLPEVKGDSTEQNTTLPRQVPTGAAFREEKKRLYLEFMRTKESTLASQFEDRRKEIEQTRQEKRLSRLQENEAKRDAFLEKVQAIGDDRVKNIVRSIDTKLTEQNTKRTDSMSAQLTKMTEVLDKLVLREIEAKKTGKDISSVDAKIVLSREAIAKASAAVEAQSAKLYVSPLTSETAVGLEMRQLVQTFRTDMTTVHDHVVAAKKTVSDALAAFGQLMGDQL